MIQCLFLLVSVGCRPFLYKTMAMYPCENMAKYLDLGSQPLLVVLFDLLPRVFEVSIILEFEETLEFVCVCDPVFASQGLGDQICKLRIAESQPSPGCHSICLVLELLRVQVMEILQDIVCFG